MKKINKNCTTEESIDKCTVDIRKEFPSVISIVHSKPEHILYFKEDYDQNGELNHK
tara:strand:- start:67 stop:234 length:168 start_codon:yes stop_codon:yes gene_type:complete